jgi:hypothetical protein
LEITTLPAAIVSISPGTPMLECESKASGSSRRGSSRFQIASIRFSPPIVRT